MGKNRLGNVTRETVSDPKTDAHTAQETPHSGATTIGSRVVMVSGSLVVTMIGSRVVMVSGSPAATTIGSPDVMTTPARGTSTPRSVNARLNHVNASIVAAKAANGVLLKLMGTILGPSGNATAIPRFLSFSRCRICIPRHATN